MWIEKLSIGVLRILTPVGPRYIQLALSQRLYMLWVFRHFSLLPRQVLNARQQRLIETLCAGQRFVSVLEHGEFGDAPILGTVEWRPPVEEETLPPSRPSRGVVPAVARMAAGSHQR